MGEQKKKFSLGAFFMEHREAPLILVLLILLVGVNIKIPGYLGSNYVNILKNCAINLVMASGMLCVLLIGSIDISVAAVLELAGAVAGVLMRDGYVTSTFVMFLVGIGIGAAVGLINGVLMSYGRVLPIIVTLGMTYMARALIPMDFILGMNKIARIDLADSFKDFILEPVMGLPLLIYIALAVALVIGLFLKFTRVGRSLYAVGSNVEAAEMRGVHVNLTKILAHVICGATAGMAGVMRLAEYNAIEKGCANGAEMYVIAACVLGGVSVMGGYGKMTGVVIGAILIATIDSAIPQLFMEATMMKELFKGILILVAILLNVMMQRAAKKRSLKGRNI